MDFNWRPLIVSNAKHQEEKKKFYDIIEKMHERKKKEVDNVEKERLRADIDKNIIKWNDRLYPKSRNQFNSHFMSVEGLAKQAEQAYGKMGVGTFTFITGRGKHSPNGVSAQQTRLLEMFKGRPRCDVRIDGNNKGLVILERW